MQGLICLQHIVNHRVIFIFVQKGSFYRLPPTPTPPPLRRRETLLYSSSVGPHSCTQDKRSAGSLPSLPPSLYLVAWNFARFFASSDRVINPFLGGDNTWVICEKKGQHTVRQRLNLQPIIIIIFSFKDQILLQLSYKYLQNLLRISFLI